MEKAGISPSNKLRDSDKDSSYSELISPGLVKTISRVTQNELKSHKSSIGLSKKELKEVTEVFNSIHNLFDNKEINKAMNSVHNIHERIILIDKILQRREEVKNAHELMKIEGNPRLFRKVKEKFISRISMNIQQRQSIATPQNINGMKTERDSEIKDVRRRRAVTIKLPQVSSPMISINPPPLTASLSNSAMNKFFPELEEENNLMSALSVKSKTNALTPSNTVNFSTAVAGSETPSQGNASAAGAGNSKKRLLKVLTNFDVYDQDHKPKEEGKSPKSSIKFAKSLYKEDYHLAHFETQKKNSKNEKFYEIRRSNSTYGLINKIGNAAVKKVVEHDLYKFWENNKERLKMNYEEFLNFNLEDQRKYFVDIETEVKAKIKKEETIEQNNLNRRVLYMASNPRFHHSCYDGKDMEEDIFFNEEESVLNKSKGTSLLKKGRKTIKKNDITLKPLTYDYSIIYKRSLTNKDLTEASVKKMLRLSGISHDYFGNDESFASFTEMKLDKIYKEARKAQEFRKQTNSYESLIKPILKPRKLNIKTAF